MTAPYYGRLLEEGHPTKYAKFTSKRSRDHWLNHDRVNRYTLPSSGFDAGLMSQLSWVDVEGVLLADMPEASTDIQEVLNRIEGFRQQMDLLEDDIDDAYEGLSRMVIASYNKHRPKEDQLHLDECLQLDTPHACAKSPTLRCVYTDDSGDDFDDDCLFCGLPRVRK